MWWMQTCQKYSDDARILMTSINELLYTGSGNLPPITTVKEPPKPKVPVMNPSFQKMFPTAYLQPTYDVDPARF